MSTATPDPLIELARRSLSAYTTRDRRMSLDAIVARARAAGAGSWSGAGDVTVLKQDELSQAVTNGKCVSDVVASAMAMANAKSFDRASVEHALIEASILPRKEKELHWTHEIVNQALDLAKPNDDETQFSLPDLRTEALRRVARADQMYEACGRVLGLAVFNRQPMGVKPCETLCAALLSAKKGGLCPGALSSPPPSVCEEKEKEKEKEEGKETLGEWGAKAAAAVDWNALREIDAEFVRGLAALVRTPLPSSSSKGEVASQRDGDGGGGDDDDDDDDDDDGTALHFERTVFLPSGKLPAPEKPRAVTRPLLRGDRPERLTRVRNENKAAFVALSAGAKLYGGGRERAMLAMRHGFQAVIPAAACGLFSPAELSDLICTGGKKSEKATGGSGAVAIDGLSRDGGGGGGGGGWGESGAIGLGFDPSEFERGVVLKMERDYYSSTSDRDRRRLNTEELGQLYDNSPGKSPARAGGGNMQKGSAASTYFWRVFRTLSPAEMRALLMFWGGSETPAVLQEEDAEYTLTLLETRGDRGDAEELILLPTAETCGRNLNLPAYSSYAATAKAVRIVLGFGSGYAKA